MSKSSVSVGLALLLVASTSLALEPAGPSAMPRAHSIAGYRVIVSPVLPNYPSAYPRAMDAQGMLVGHSGTDPWDNVAAPMLAKGQHISALRRPFGSLNFALGVGNRRLVVGTSAMQPVAWVDGVPVLLPGVAGLHQGEGRDANSLGAICGALVNDITGQQKPVYWPSASAAGSALDLAGASGGAAHSISETGRIAGALSGGAYSAYGFVGARWDGVNLPPSVILPLPGANNCELVSVNDDGDAAGRCGFNVFMIEAVLHNRQAGTLTGLGFLPGGSYSEARGVNNARVVVGVANRPGALRAFRWQNGVIEDLNDLVLGSTEPILSVIDAVAILDDGRIAAEVLVATPLGNASRMAVLRPVGP